MPRTKHVKRAAGPTRVEVKSKAILDAATELFVEARQPAHSMDTVSKALGVTKPFLYYFKDKADILAAVCRRGADLHLQLGGADGDCCQARRPSAWPTLRAPWRGSSCSTAATWRSTATKSPTCAMRTATRSDVCAPAIDLKVEALIQAGLDYGRVRPRRRADHRNIDHRHAEPHLSLVSAGRPRLGREGGLGQRDPGAADGRRIVARARAGRQPAVARFPALRGPNRSTPSSGSQRQASPCTEVRCMYRPADALVVGHRVVQHRAVVPDHQAFVQLPSVPVDPLGAGRMLEEKGRRRGASAGFGRRSRR